jgi:hypothetical protein
MRARSWKFAGLVAVVGIALAGCLAPGTHTVTPTLKNNTAAPGIWHTFGGNGCYWARLSGLSGAPADIIASAASVSGPRYVEVKSTDAGFTTKSCLPWVQAGGPFDRKIGVSSTGEFGNGDYRIGPDIAAGAYTASNTAGCYWARLSGFGGQTADIIASSLGTGTVTIDAGDKGFSTTGCGTWKPAP